MENLKPEQYAVMALAQIVTEENDNSKYEGFKGKLQSLLESEGYEPKKIAQDLQNLSPAFRAYDALDDFIFDSKEHMTDKTYGLIVDAMDAIWGFLSNDEIENMKKKY